MTPGPKLAEARPGNGLIMRMQAYGDPAQELGAANRTEAAARAWQLGLIP